MEEFQKVKKMVPAMTTMITLMKDDDEEMKNMLKSLEIFVDHMDELLGVFDPKFNGGDFCAGLTFGSAGSNLLFKMAETIISTHIKMVQAGKHVHQHKNKQTLEEASAGLSGDSRVGQISSGTPRHHRTNN